MSFISSLLASLPGSIGQGLIWGVMAIGVYITFRILDIADLTVDGSLATGGAVCVMMLRGGHSVVAAMIAAVCVGALAGMVTGLLHTAMKIPAILAGILTQLALYSINLRIMEGKANQPISVDKYDLLVSQRHLSGFSIQNSIIVMIIICAIIIALLYCFFMTELGCGLRATGNNQGMARAQGIDTNKNIVLGLAISNGLVALSGALISQYQGAADINMGRGAIVIGLAAVIIGEVLLEKISRKEWVRILSVVVGSIIYYIVIQIVLKLGLNTNDLKLLTSVVVALFLGVPNLKASRAAKNPK